MHVYIYDDYLNKSKYNKIINRIEIRLTDLGLNGKIIRLSNIKNIKGAIQNELRLGAKTLVAVGNNQTVNKIIGAIIDTEIYSDFQKKTVLGIIPIGDDNSISSSFGIKDGEEACNVLLARRIEKIDLGSVGRHYFLNQVEIESAGSTIDIDDYSLEVSERGEIKIINLLSDPKEKITSNPHDGKLELLIRTKKKDQTFMTIKKIRVANPQKKLLIDGIIEIDTPADIEVVQNKISVIVGKERMFE